MMHLMHCFCLPGSGSMFVAMVDESLHKRPVGTKQKKVHISFILPRQTHSKKPLELQTYSPYGTDKRE
jgi:hypothetical protein